MDVWKRRRIGSYIKHLLLLEDGPFWLVDHLLRDPVQQPSFGVMDARPRWLDRLPCRDLRSPSVGVIHSVTLVRNGVLFRSLLLILYGADLVVEQALEDLQIVGLGLVDILRLDGHLHILLLKPIRLARVHLAAGRTPRAVAPLR